MITLTSLPTAVQRGAAFAWDFLCPRWRWVWVLGGSLALYLATSYGGFGHGHIGVGNALACVVAGIAAFACLWVATRPAVPAPLAKVWRRLPTLARWRGWRAVLTLALLWIPWHGFIAQLPDDLRGHYHNDAIAFVHMDADLLRTGKNPYTADGAFWVAAVRWPNAFATPLLGSPAFGSDPLAYPPPPVQGQQLATELAHPALRGQGNFDPRTVHNYPAGIVWLALPFVWVGLPSVVWVNALAWLALLALLLWRAPAEERGGVLVAFLANPVMWLYTLLENFDVACVVFIAAAWLLWPRARLSPVLLGVAAAVKQLAWFFIPFYLVEVWRREGRTAALRRAGWTALGFVALNLPFMLASPGAWLRGLLAPQTDALFPIGYGAVALGLGGLAPLRSWLWSLAEAAALVALLAWQIRRRAATADGLLLALVPLWFAWRSPMNYFAFLPVLAVVLILSQRLTAAPDAPQPSAAHR